MKLLIFAHKPPPHHGQSYMIQLLLEALGGDVREQKPERTSAGGIQCYHLDARYSADNEDVGQARLGKVFLALRFALQAIWLRLRHGVQNLYYVPAFPARTPIYRDLLVLGLCRPFFRRIIYHWHAVGLGEWIEKEARPWERRLCRIILGRPDLNIVLRPYNTTDADILQPKRTAVVPNGIPDPCPNFAAEVHQRRLARITARKKFVASTPLTAAERSLAGPSPEVFQVFFLSLCYSGKGLFDAVEAIAIAHRRLKDSPIRVQLVVAGKFWLEAEKVQFEKRIAEPDLQGADGPLVRYHGFAGGDEKKRLFLESDVLCFPTKMPESFGLVLCEGMAFGLPLITTRWRNIPEMLPPEMPGIVDPGAPEQIAEAILRCLTADYDPQLREHFLNHYTDTRFAENMKRVLPDCLPSK